MPAEVKTPWLKNMGEIPAHLEYPDGSMYEALEQIALRHPHLTATVFMGRKTSYRRLLQDIGRCARALRAIGVRPGERVTVALPNCPQAVTLFYAVNLVGAVANMIHPLSGEQEIACYLRESGSRYAVVPMQLYRKFEPIRPGIPPIRIIVVSPEDALSLPMRAGYRLTEGRKVPRIPKDAPVLRWNAFIDRGRGWGEACRPPVAADDTAVILYSGGTTGTGKGVLLSNQNFNALARQILATNPMFRPGDRMLAAMPIFHGFGLGISIHAMLVSGGCCVLLPRFTPDRYAKLLVKHRCNLIAGVPTLFEALLRCPRLDGADLSCLKGVYSGGDRLSPELKERFDRFLHDRKCRVQVREGYGTTECVTASCLTPHHISRVGSVGLPFPDTYYKIVKPGTCEEVPYGEAGEICLAGPTVMQGYMNRPEETARTLRTHPDGLTWVHTGDLGTMDGDGFVYFRQRIKRVIITGGYNVYPARLEQVFDAHPLVRMSCVIGVPDPLKIQKIKAFIVLNPGVSPSRETRDLLLAHAEKHIAKYALPHAVEFRAELPQTSVGKVAYRVLEEEEAAGQGAESTQ